MKSFLALIILIFLTACTNTRYYYYPENYKNSDISISASLVEFDKEDYFAIEMLSGTYFEQKKYVEAEKFLLPLAKKGNTQAQWFLAMGYFETKKFKEAESWAKKALDGAKKEGSFSKHIEQLLMMLDGELNK
mgnify:CR=1 FL=1